MLWIKYYVSMEKETGIRCSENGIMREMGRGGCIENTTWLWWATGERKRDPFSCFVFEFPLQVCHLTNITSMGGYIWPRRSWRKRIIKKLTNRLWKVRHDHHEMLSWWTAYKRSLLRAATQMQRRLAGHL